MTPVVHEIDAVTRLPGPAAEKPDDSCRRVSVRANRAHCADSARPPSSDPTPLVARLGHARDPRRLLVPDLGERPIGADAVAVHHDELTGARPAGDGGTGFADHQV